MSDTFVKSRHRDGCTGRMYRVRGTVCIDRIGRVGNGGIVAHDYRCNGAWTRCPARVLVTETALRSMAVAAIGDAA